MYIYIYIYTYIYIRCIYGAYMVSINVSINEKNYVFNPHGSPFGILESLGFSDFSKMEFTLTELFSK